MKGNLKHGFGIFNYHRHHSRDFEKYEGFCIDLLEKISKTLEFSYGNNLPLIYSKGRPQYNLIFERLKLIIFLNEISKCRYSSFCSQNMYLFLM